MSHTGQDYPAIPPDTAVAGQALDSASPFHALAHGMQTLYHCCRRAAPDGWTSAQVAAHLQHGLVTLLQIEEGLTDRQAAEASHARLEWKYALHWSLRHPGFKAADLCRYRQQILTDPLAWTLFLHLVATVQARGLWPLPSADADTLRALIARLCRLNLAHWATEAMTQALEGLATWQPEWLRRVAPARWYTRYGVSGPLDGARREPLPAQEALRDVASLLSLLDSEGRPELALLPEVRRLRCVSVWSGDPAGTPVCSECPLGNCIAHGCFSAGHTLPERNRIPCPDGTTT